MGYSKLKGRIKEVFGTQYAFADAVGMDQSSVSAKLNNKSEWTRPQIIKACDVLGIPLADAPEYFFYQKN